MTDNLSKKPRWENIDQTSNEARSAIRFDNNNVVHFRQKSRDTSGGEYQTLVNNALRKYIQERYRKLHG